MLLRYGLERLLFRLGESRHAGTFVLKGAMLFPLWSGSPHRATKDMDLLGSGPPNIPRFVDVFREVAGVTIDDGLIFLPDTVAGAAIREEALARQDDPFPSCSSLLGRCGAHPALELGTYAIGDRDGNRRSPSTSHAATTSPH